MPRNSSSYTYTVGAVVSGFTVVSLSAQKVGAAIGADIVADSGTDTLTLSAGPHIALISDPITDTITISGQDVIGSSGSGGSAHNLTPAISGEWKSAYTTTNANSAQWALNAGDVTNLANTSATWDAVVVDMTNVANTSATWDAVVVDMTNVANTSANWNAAIDDITNVANTSATWDAVVVDMTNVANTSATWNAVIDDMTNVANASAGWNVGTSSIATVGTIGTGTWQGTAIAQAYIANDAINGDKLADDAVDSEHYTDGSIDTAHIADNQVTLAKMAGLARGKLIIGDASGNPVALAAGSNGQVLEIDSNGDIVWGTDGGGSGGSAHNLTDAISGEWKSAYTTANTYSANWNAVIDDMTNVANASANWNAVIDDMTNVANASADWNGAYTTANTYSAGWIAGTSSIVTVGTIGTGTWQGTAIAQAYIAGDAIDGSKLADDAVNSEHYTDGSIDTAHIADDQVTLAKMAGLARGKLIIGDASGNPVALAAGSNGQVLEIDSNGDIVWGTDGGGSGGAAHNLTDAISGEWKSAYTTANTYSANWNAAIDDVTNVANASADWNGAYTTANTGSADWTYVADNSGTNVPMTFVNRVGSGTATADTDGASSTYNAAKAFDGNDGTFFEPANDAGQFPNWLKYDFGSGNAYTITAVTFRIDGGHDNYVDRAPKDWFAQGSNNDSDWVSLGTFPNTVFERVDTGQQNYVYVVTNDTAYRYIRITIDNVQNGAGLLRITEIKLSELVAKGYAGNFVLEDDSGDEVTIEHNNEVKFIGSGITTNWTDTDNGTDSDPYDLTFTVDAAQTGITSLLATDIKIGEDDQTKIDFEDVNEIHFYANNVEQVYLADNIFGPQSDSDVDLGTTGVRWKDAFVDSLTTTGDIDCGGEVQTANIGYTDGDNAMTIADGGKVTFAAGFAVGSDAEGDIVYHNGTTYVRLAKGTDDHVLTMNGNVPNWEAASGGSGGGHNLTPAISGEWKSAYTTANTYSANWNAVIDDMTNVANASAGWNVGTSSIATVGTIGTGTWQGTAVALGYGGTGLVGATDGKIVIADGSGAPVHLDVGSSTAITILGTVATGVWQGTAIAQAYIAGDAINGSKLADDAVNSEHYTDGSIDTAHIADDQVTLAKMAGITRGSIIIGNASGNPAALAIGTNDYVLTSDGTDIAWEAAAGGGSSEWTDTGSVLHPTDSSGTADAVVIGGTTAGNSDIAFNTDGSAVFNEQSASVDFRVESNGNANMLFVDGSADAVGIGTSAPVAALTVGGEVSASGGFSSAVKPITTLTSNGVVTYDITGPALQTIILKANQANTYLGTESLPTGKTVTIRLSANGANRTLGWHTSMNFVGEKPASIARDKVALLSVTTFGTLCGGNGVDTDVVCAYAVED